MVTRYAQKIALEKGTKKPPRRPAREFPRQPAVQPPKSDSQSLAGRGDFTIPKRGKHWGFHPKMVEVDGFKMVQVKNGGFPHRNMVFIRGWSKGTLRNGWSMGRFEKHLKEEIGIWQTNVGMLPSKLATATEPWKCSEDLIPLANLRAIIN